MSKQKQKKCPICAKLQDAVYAPFCSRHCKNADLISWANEAYRIPTEEDVLDGFDQSENSSDKAD